MIYDKPLIYTKPLAFYKQGWLLSSKDHLCRSFMFSFSEVVMMQKKKDFHISFGTQPANEFIFLWKIEQIEYLPLVHRLGLSTNPLGR